MGSFFPSDKFPSNKAFSALPCPKVGWSDPPPLDYYGNPIPPPEVDMGPQWQQQQAELQDAIFNINNGPVQNNAGPGEQEDIDFPWGITAPGCDAAGEPVFPGMVVEFVADGDGLSVACLGPSPEFPNAFTITYTLEDTVLSSFDIKDDDNESQTVNDGEEIKFVGAADTITTDLAESMSTGDHILTIGLDLTELPYYDANETQVIEHVSSAAPKWAANRGGTWDVNADDGSGLPGTVHHTEEVKFIGTTFIDTEYAAVDDDHTVTISLEMKGTEGGYAGDPYTAATDLAINWENDDNTLRLFIDPKMIAGHVAANQQVLTHAADGDWAWVNVESC